MSNPVTMTKQNTPLLTGAPSVVEPPTLSIPPAIKNRCACCAKKLTLADFACGKCQVRHCGAHRLPETHACAHDFKAAGREQLTKQLTRVVSDKIEHI
jgi:hypothetical protein